jgi:hypothetical protein
MAVETRTQAMTVGMRTQAMARLLLLFEQAGWLIINVKA